MKILTYIFILLAINVNVFAQSSKPYTIEYFVNKIIDKGQYVDDEKISKKDEINTRKIIYTYNLKKDSIAYYDFYNSKITLEQKPTTYLLFKNGDTLSLKYKKYEVENNLKISFNNKKKTITIGSKDIFYLNTEYFNYLYQSIYENLNTLDLVDFLGDFLEDYNLDDLIYISSYEKYKHKNFRIIKAYMESYRSQAPNYLDKWNVKFSYNKNGILKYVLKESTEGDQSLEKKIISSEKNIFRYATYKNNESRLIVDSEVLFDLKKKTFKEEIIGFQVGLGKETRYNIQRVSYKVISSKQLFLNQKNIMELKSVK